MWVYICEICGGTGKEIEYFYNPSTGERRENEITCERCYGDGYKKAGKEYDNWD